MPTDRDQMPDIYTVKCRPASGQGVVETLTLKNHFAKDGRLELTEIIHYSHGKDLAERE